MPEAKKARAVGFNHVAIEVGDIDEALAFYGRLFDFKLRGKSRDAAFIDLGDQFLAFRRAAGKRPMMAGISGWWWMTRRRCARPYQGTGCASRHGAIPYVEERGGDQGAEGQGHGAGLNACGHAVRQGVWPPGSAGSSMKRPPDGA
jgi:catechol 2,3-dioxygenase-like lactoylglutathione lyase family enzyme